MPKPSQILFLPGASGNVEFWRPVTDAMQFSVRKEFVAYPGFGLTPADPTIASLEDLAGRVRDRINQPTALVAQSMGGVVAILAALESPGWVTHLVLTATSGGIDTNGLGAVDWRKQFRDEFPQVPQWFETYKLDLTSELSRLSRPVLLLWGDSDPISPVAVGQKLHGLLPTSTLRIVVGGEHDLAQTHAPLVARIVDDYLTSERFASPCEH